MLDCFKLPITRVVLENFICRQHRKGMMQHKLSAIKASRSLSGQRYADIRLRRDAAYR